MGTIPMILKFESPTDIVDVGNGFIVLQGIYIYYV
jgi:hypothetical protein